MAKERAKDTRGFDWSYLIIFGFMLLVLLPQLWTVAQQVETVPFSEFESLLRDNKLEVSLGVRALCSRHAEGSTA